MTFPEYHLYQAAIAQRNLFILYIAGAAALGFTWLWLVRQFRPGWAQPAIWVLMVGGYYATFLVVAVYFFSRA